MMNANVEVKDDFPKTSKKLSFAKILSTKFSKKIFKKFLKNFLKKFKK